MIADQFVSKDEIIKLKEEPKFKLYSILFYHFYEFFEGVINWFGNDPDSEDEIIEVINYLVRIKLRKEERLNFIHKWKFSKPLSTFNIPAQERSDYQSFFNRINKTLSDIEIPTIERIRLFEGINYKKGINANVTTTQNDAACDKCTFKADLKIEELVYLYENLINYKLLNSESLQKVSESDNIDFQLFVKVMSNVSIDSLNEQRIKWVGNLTTFLCVFFGYQGDKVLDGKILNFKGILKMENFNVEKILKAFDFVNRSISEQMIIDKITKISFQSRFKHIEMIEEIISGFRK